MEPKTLEYRATRSRTAWYATVAAGFVALSAWLALRPEGRLSSHAAGYLGIFAFGFCLLFLVAELVRPRVTVWLDAEGIHSRQALRGNDFDLPWSELAAVRVVAFNRQPFVVFDARDPGWGMAGVPPIVRGMRGANRALVGSWMTFAPKIFGIEAERFAAEVDRYRHGLVPHAAVARPQAPP